MKCYVVHFEIVYHFHKHIILVLCAILYLLDVVSDFPQEILPSSINPTSFHNICRRKIN